MIATEADPIAVGYLPNYAFGPWDNEHRSHAVADYARWPQRVPPISGHVHAYDVITGKKRAVRGFGMEDGMMCAVTVSCPASARMVRG